MNKGNQVATSNANVINNATEVASSNINNKTMDLRDYCFGTQSPVRTDYDNQGAYDTLQLMMQRGERLNVEFRKHRENNKIYAWVESRNVAAFSYYLKPESFRGLINYLQTGEVTDFDTNPMESDTLEDDTDFGLFVLKSMIKDNQRIQYVPLFRERPENLKAFLPLLNGKIIFKVKRTPELLDYLREEKQVI